MNKFFIVLAHTYLTKLKSKTFIFTTLIFALFVGVGFNLPNIIAMFEDSTKELKQIGVVDQTGKISPALASLSEQVNSDNPLAEQLQSNLNYVDIPSEAEAQRQLDEKILNGYLFIEGINEGLISATFKADKMNVDEQRMSGTIQGHLSQVQLSLLVSELKLSPQDASKLFQPVELNKQALNPEAKSEDELALSIALVYILLFALYISSLMYGNLVAMEVATEKSSRVMEILISSVSPVAQMFGKIIGIALLGLTQFAIMISIAYTSTKFGDKKISIDGFNIDFSDIPASTIIYAVIFFILGYFLYSTMAAMLGSLVSRTEELQQMLTPMMLPIIIAFIIAMFSLTTPDTLLVVITSYIPFFTPMIMFMRIGLSDPALWEILLSIGILIATIIGLAVLASRVYRGAVLMYGKASLKDFGKALSMHKNS